MWNRRMTVEVILILLLLAALVGAVDQQHKFNELTCPQIAAIAAEHR